CGAGDRD
ncbi:hypothetical protein KL933_005406, partial [Ogataea haglerorum]